MGENPLRLECCESSFLVSKELLLCVTTCNDEASVELRSWETMKIQAMVTTARILYKLSVKVVRARESTVRAGACVTVLLKNLPPPPFPTLARPARVMQQGLLANLRHGPAHG